jgi:hypothetical protein
LDPSRTNHHLNHKKWLSKKTSGLGYTMALYRSGLGASVLVSLSPFFFGLRRSPRAASVASATALDSAHVLIDGSDDVNIAAPAPTGVDSMVVVEEEVSIPSQPLPAEPPLGSRGSVEGKETQQQQQQREEDDEIPVPVLANGQQEEGKTPANNEEGGRSAVDGGGGEGEAGAAQEEESANGPGPEKHEGGGGLVNEGAGANTIGVA